MSQISHDEVRHIAHLARLSLSDEELKKFSAQLSAILQFVSTLQKVKTTEIVAPPRRAEGTVVGREDRVIACEDTNRDALLGTAPQRRGGGIAVPAVFES